MIFVERTVNGCDALKFINLAARVHIRAQGFFNIELALEAGALLEESKIGIIYRAPDRPHAFPASCLALSPEYDKKPVTHKKSALQRRQGCC